jgi:hypothetical protein
MAKVKILLEPGESQLDADHALQKALEHHSQGSAHDDESFDDPAMVDLAQRLESDHSKMYIEMMREILDVLDEEYSSDGNL